MTWNIDRICSLTKRPALLNALHTCRPNHPWHKDAKTPFRDAAFLAQQHPSYIIPQPAIDWLLAQSKERGEG